ncbi:MAG: hypothetical protein JEZ02_08410 [Desulfatibacillum sp.]|nr:hypothetical protein [Desulfatibacillum sp.]
MTRPFFISGLIGLLVVLMSTAMLFVFPTKAPGLPEGFATPIIAFEFAKSPADIITLFGPKDSPERDAMVRSMDLGNKLDYVYMVLYTAFLALFSVQVVRRTGLRIFYLAAGLAGVALVGDALENLRLFAITSSLDTMDIEADLAALHVFTWAKWGSLALIFPALSPYFFKGGRFSMTIGIVGIFCPVLGIAGYFHPGAFCEMFSVSVAVMFLLMIAYCLIYKEPV